MNSGRLGVEDLRVRAPFGRALLAFFVLVQYLDIKIIW